MNKIAWALVSILILMFGIPIGAALLVISAAAAAQETRTISCDGAIPASGTWRPPFVQAYTVSQRGFGGQFHPIYKEWRMHTGQDMSSQPGPGPIVSIGSGRVIFAGVKGSYGNAVDVEHVDGGTGQKVVSRYAHMASLSVRTGATVTAGQQLGVEGSTGASTGNHLHLEIRIADKPVDPAAWMKQRGAPLNGHAIAPSRPQPGQPVEEGGIGFPLPAPGTPRQASLRNPPQPIPADIKRLYVTAAARYKVPWTLLAGIGMEETVHGRVTAVSSAGAQGLMQFMPATWASMGVDGDGDGDGRAHIINDADSVMSAANYLTKSGVTGGPAGVRKALFAYNRADWYVNDVLYYAQKYGGGEVLGSTTECAPGQGNSDLPALTNKRLSSVLTWASGQVGDRYVMGANGPDAWDCSSFTQAAYAQIGVTTPRTAQAQRAWLAAGNGFRVQPDQARPGDLIFWDGYLGPNVIGHVAMVFDPVKKTTVEAMNSKRGVTYGSYATKVKSKNIFEVWRVGNISDAPTRTAN